MSMDGVTVLTGWLFIMLVLLFGAVFICAPVYFGMEWAENRSRGAKGALTAIAVLVYFPAVVMLGVYGALAWSEAVSWP